MTLQDIRPFNAPRTTGDWSAARLAEAPAVIADVAHHSDHLLCIACSVLASHGESEAERRDARALLFVIDARRPISQAQRENNGEAEQ